LQLFVLRRHPERSEGPLYFSFAVVCFGRLLFLVVILREAEDLLFAFAVAFFGLSS
jgi:hypothetical protein